MSDTLLCYASFISDIVCGIMKYPYHYWDILLLAIITAVISNFWQLDLAWNKITPVIPLTLGAFTGMLMAFRLSVWIKNTSTMFSSILQQVRRETYVVLVFSQITIMCINHFSL